MVSSGGGGGGGHATTVLDNEFSATEYPVVIGQATGTSSFGTYSSAGGITAAGANGGAGASGGGSGLIGTISTGATT